SAAPPHRPTPGPSRPRARRRRRAIHRTSAGGSNDGSDRRTRTAPGRSRSRLADSPGTRRPDAAPAPRIARTTAARAPRARTDTRRRTAKAPSRSPRTAWGTARRATVPARADATPRRRHERYGRVMSTAASEPLPRPLSSTRRDPSVRINGEAVALPRPVSSSSSSSRTCRRRPSANSFSVTSEAGSTRRWTLIESPEQSTCSTWTVASSSLTSRPTFTGPRRTVARGHGTENRRPPPCGAGDPATSPSHTSVYQPGSSSDSGSSNGTNTSRCGTTSSVTGAIGTGPDPPGPSAAARALPTTTWCGFASSPRKMNAPLTVAGNRSNRARTEIGSLTARDPPAPGSGPLLPRAQVVLLLGGERVDLDPHRLELQFGDLLVDLGRHGVHAGIQRPAALDDPLDGQDLVRERHVHDGRRMPLGRGEVHEAPLAQQMQTTAVTHRVPVEQPADPPHAATRELGERPLVDLDVEMTRVRHDRAVLHDLEVLAPDHARVAGDGDEHVTDPGGLAEAHDPDPLPRGLERRQRVDLGDDDVRAHPPRPRGHAATAHPVPGHDERATREQEVGRTHDRVDSGLARAEPVVEQGLGVWLVPRDDRVRQH